MARPGTVLSIDVVAKAPRLRFAASIAVGVGLCLSSTSALLLSSCIGDDPGVTPTSTTDSGSDSNTNVVDAGPTGPCDDRTFCDDKCGPALPDTCNVVRDCSTPCGDGRKCDNVRCVCKTSDAWCQGRCGLVKDNCDKDLPCAACDGGVACISGTCAGCTPKDKTDTCSGKQCGFATNNCGQQVNCGDCAGGAVCNNNICCAPQSTTCAGGRCGSVTNNCGLQVLCTNPCCPSGSPISCCPNGQPLNAPSNCGACNHDCTGPFTCSSGTCFCTNHNSNTDPYDCGGCSIGPTGPLNCITRGFQKATDNPSHCVQGVCN